MQAVAGILVLSPMLASWQVPCGMGQPQPFWPAESTIDEHIGACQSMSSDGRLLCVGNPQRDELGTDTGCAYLFDLTSSSVQQVAKLLPSAPLPYNGFGARSTFSEDGRTLVISAPGAASGFGSPASVYVYGGSGSMWSELAVLNHPVPVYGDLFGFAVSVDRNGERILIGAPGQRNHRGVRTGTATMFRRSSNGWVVEQEILPPDGEEMDHFGQQVALSSDGTTLAVASPGYDIFPPFWIQQSNNGAVYEYRRRETDDHWRFSNLLTAADPTWNDLFGYSLAMDSSGSTLLAGAPQHISGVNYVGAAYVFSCDSMGAWLQTEKLSPSTTGIDHVFGHALDLSSAGDVAVVSSSWSSMVSAFRHDGVHWVLGGEVAGTVVSSAFGESVSIDALGRRWVVGEPADSMQGHWSGTLHRIEWPCASVVTYCTAKTNSLGCVPRIGFSGSASLTEASGFAIQASDVVSQRSGHLFYGFGVRASVPFKGGTLCVEPPLRRTPVQSSGGNPGGIDCSGAYSFDFNAWIAAGHEPGLAELDQIRAQFWSRDPQSPIPFGLTDAIEFRVGP